ncbi:23S rRNA (pseudouridine(1915)-N(3))-methyltransferase RlmH [Candidatus Gracilibacteria bacterium]|nr:23S rRNA (pseudouridine(1915)-N(3))-methyltransferase RlmH [Candidatus Gracilibacteria bacterium]
MMKIKLYFFGKQNEIEMREKELLKRIGFRSKIEVIAFPQAGLDDEMKTKDKEGNVLLNKFSVQDFVVVLDEHGEEMDSLEFSKYIKLQLVEQGTVIFVIGGAYGLSDMVLNRANKKIRFGKMVWTRNLVRLMALEQIYRALEIDGGGNFHKN